VIFIVMKVNNICLPDMFSPESRERSLSFINASPNKRTPAVHTTCDIRSPEYKRPCLADVSKVRYYIDAHMHWDLLQERTGKTSFLSALSVSTL
jgi:hypothetical protein